MYEVAYSEGYQTVFVELHDSGGEARDMWANGRMLAGMLEEIYHHFGKELVLITHSKGGVDAQTALVHYKAYPYVSNVITLGAPHYGTQLADLAYSTWSWWLAATLGYRSEGTYSMQTGYMNWFRSITDDLPYVRCNQYYTLADTSGGPPFSALYWGGLYLSQYGPNDGMVVVDYAYLPHGEMVRIDAWNHSEIAFGSHTFGWFKPYLTTSSTGVTGGEASQEHHFQAAGKTGKMCNTVLRGGAHNRTATERFGVEEGVHALTIDWMGAEKLGTLELIDPSGNKQRLEVKVTQDGYFFAGAYHHYVTLEKPQPGEWTIRVQQQTGDAEGAYLLTVFYHSDVGGPDKLVDDSIIRYN